MASDLVSAQLFMIGYGEQFFCEDLCNKGMGASGVLGAIIVARPV